jgi:hypothetical protein
MTSKGQLVLYEANSTLDKAMNEWFDGLTTDQRDSYSMVLKRLATSA